MMKAVKIAWAWSYSGYFMQLYLLYNHNWKTHQKDYMLNPGRLLELLNKQAPFYYIIFLYWEQPMEDTGGCTWVYFNA